MDLGAISGRRVRVFLSPTDVAAQASPMQVLHARHGEPPLGHVASMGSSACGSCSSNMFQESNIS